ncbi:MAG: hypothetical protein J6C59_03870 [Muribaculaceae bacterium]|nr:hypothetical protein [Muribaculaceae bacterium]
MKHSRLAYRFASRIGALLLLAVLLLASCSKDKNEKAEALFSTVPEKAQAVALVDIEKITDDFGSLDALFSRLPEGDTAGGAQAKDLLSTVDMTGYAVVFADGFHWYATALLDDPTAFMEKYSKIEKGGAFVEKNGVNVLGKVAVKDDQLWIKLNGNDVDPLDIKGYAALSDNDSFMACKYHEKMVESGRDVAFLGSLSGMVSQVVKGQSDSAMAQLVISTLFKDAQFLAGTVAFEKGKGEAAVEVLDSKFGLAPFLLPAGTVDINTVKQLGETADLVGAVAIPSKLVDKVASLGRAFGGALPDVYLNILRPIDGTVAVCGGTAPGSMNGIVTTNGSDTSALFGMINSVGNMTVKKEGNLVLFRQGEAVAGPLNVAGQAELMKGVMAACTGAAPQQMAEQGVSRIFVGLYPDKGSLRLKCIFFGNDPKANILSNIKLK